MSNFFYCLRGYRSLEFHSSLWRTGRQSVQKVKQRNSFFSSYYSHLEFILFIHGKKFRCHLHAVLLLNKQNSRDLVGTERRPQPGERKKEHFAIIFPFFFTDKKGKWRWMVCDAQSVHCFTTWLLVWRGKCNRVNLFPASSHKLISVQGNVGALASNIWISFIRWEKTAEEVDRTDGHCCVHYSNRYITQCRRVSGKADKNRVR